MLAKRTGQIYSQPYPRNAGTKQLHIPHFPRTILPTHIPHITGKRLRYRLNKEGLTVLIDQSQIDALVQRQSNVFVLSGLPMFRKMMCLIAIGVFFLAIHSPAQTANGFMDGTIADSSGLL
jgi:hypothetical protein